MNVVGTETTISALYENIHNAGMDDVVANDINVLSNTIFINSDLNVYTQILSNSLYISCYDDIPYYLWQLITSDDIINVIFQQNSDIKKSEYIKKLKYGFVYNDISLIIATQNINNYFDNSEYNKIEYISDNACWCISTDIFILPNNIKYIDDTAFEHSNILSIFSYGNTLYTINNYAFEKSFIQYIELSSCNEILAYAFSDCKLLSSIIFPTNLTKLGIGAFQNCISLSNINLSHTQLSNIEHTTFANCSSLTDISFPSTLLSINNIAFYGCSNLSSFDFTNVKPMKLNEQIFYSSNKCGYSIFVNEKDYNEWINLNNYLLYNETNMSSHIKILNISETEAGTH